MRSESISKSLLTAYRIAKILKEIVSLNTMMIAVSSF